MIDRRRQLRELYGFDFPEHFFHFWEFAQRLRPLEPLNAFEELDLRLVGPFEVLAGRFDKRSPRLSPLLHWRYPSDPPEFFTAMVDAAATNEWGLYFDAPGSDSICVAAYDREQDFELSTEGGDLFQALRMFFENQCGVLDFAIEAGEYTAQQVEGFVRSMRDFCQKLTAVATGERKEVGLEYMERYGDLATRQVEVVAETCEGMGIVVPPEQYRPLALPDEDLWQHLFDTDDPAGVVEEARRALRDGFPGTALKLGKDLWAVGDERHMEYAYELLDAAYAALGRDKLREVLRVQRAHRDRPSVDILEAE